MMLPRMILRTDGNAKIGLGHVFRCISIASLLKNDFSCIFFIQKPSEFIEELINKYYGFELVSLENSGNLSAEEITSFINEHDLVILDGYHFDHSYQKKIKEITNSKVISIDDIYDTHFVSDAVINHIGGIDPVRYKKNDETQLFLGPHYTILREEFYHFNGNRTPGEKLKNLFINMGGADGNNVTLQILSDIEKEKIDIEEIIVVVGSAYKYYEELKEYASQFGNIKIFNSLSVSQMIDCMSKAGIAICSASTVAYEYCSIGGLLFVIQTAGNQHDMVRYLVESGLALPYTDFFNIINSGKEITIANEMKRKQKTIFDGKAGDRLTSVVKNVYLKNNLQVRKAQEIDLDIYYYWANDDEARKNSFNTMAIPYEDHCKWFHTRLKDGNSCLYIFTTKNEIPIANVRFLINKEEAVLSYLIDKHFRGIGLGKMILQLAKEQFFNEYRTVKSIKGFVKGNNTSSVRSFLSSGFQETEFDNSHYGTDAKCFMINNN